MGASFALLTVRVNVSFTDAALPSETVCSTEKYLRVVPELFAAAREKLGVPWTASQERQLRLLGRAVRFVVPRLPERLRYFPIAYEARRLEASRQRLRKVIDLRPM